ncbi:MAG: hypothetical protein HC862_11075 [Scytonema sp. RU_4_4]|nr:hypothetical protein [Scytonema sp. RU_4_4]NJR73342.1 hypothetical protein [Scytonema sp. CRU_2_7]
MNIIKGLRQYSKRILVLIFILVLASLLLGFSPAWSSNSMAQKQVTISANQVIDDDLYLAGETLTIDGTVKGDAVLAGKQITINGTIDGDLIAAGQTVVINGAVNDDVRVAGQVLTLDSKAKVKDDLIAAGASLENKAGSSIGGDVNFFGAQALLAGTVSQNVLGAMNSLELRGSVGRNMRVVAVGDPDPLQAPFIPKPAVVIPQIPQGLTLTDTAQIGGKLTYQSTQNAQINQKAQVAGGVVREELSYEGQPHRTGWNRFVQSQSPGEILLQHLQRFGALLLIGWLLLRFVPLWTQGLAATVQAQPLPSLGWGVVTFIGVWLVVCVIGIITLLLTVPLAFTLPDLILPIIGIGTLTNLFISVGFAIFASFVPPMVLSFLGGRWLMHQLRPDRPTGRFISLLVGLVVFVILTAIPVLGSILSLIVILFGLGAVWQWGRTRMSRTQDRQLTPV